MNRFITRTIQVVRSILVTGLILTLAVVPIAAQEPPPAESEVLRSLRVIQDETSPISFRSQEITRVLLSGDPTGLEGLRRILGGPESSLEVRLAVVGGAVVHPALALYEDVLSAILSADAPEFLTRAEASFRQSRLPELVRKLTATAADRAADPGRRLLAIRLLARVATRTAAEALVRLWSNGEDPIAGKAREALLLVLPVRFRDPAEAEAYFAERKALDMEALLRDALGAASGEDAAGSHRRLVEFAGRMLNQASVEQLVVLYLACADIPEIRRLGAERLAGYPFAEREGPGEGKARSRAAGAVLAGLAAEEEPEVKVALLKAVRALVETVRAEAADPAFEQVSKCLEDPDPQIRAAAVAMLGALRDARAVYGLTGLFDRLGGEQTDLRIGILDALELIGDGIAPWVSGKIGAGEAQERVTVRLVQLLRGYPEDRSGIPVLVDLLKGGRGSELIRREAASTLGIVGVSAGVPEAIDALCVFGLVDEDPSVRDIAATQLGRAKGGVPGKVIEMLRQRLTDAETSPRVRLSAARSLLRLRGETAIPEIAEKLKDEEFWREAVRDFLKSDLIGAGDVVRAVAFVRGICRAGMCDRCIEAARLVLDAQELTWPAEAASLRIQVAMDLAGCLSGAGRYEETLKVLRDEVPEALPTGEERMVRALLFARACRKTGDPESGLTVLAALKDGEAPAVRIERAWCLTALGRYDDAEEAVGPLVPSEEWGKAAQEVLDAAAMGRMAAASPAVPGDAELLVADLDGPDEAVRAAAVDELRELGKAARPALLAWLAGRSADQIAAAVATLAKITGLPLAYDPAAPEADRLAALEAVRNALK